MKKGCAPVCIDLFAGPGGLGEGFSRAGFSVPISIEKEAIECRTLIYRKIHNSLLKEGRKQDAQRLAEMKFDDDAIKGLFPEEMSIARKQVAQLELGAAPFSDVYLVIDEAISDDADGPLVLLGGPPCQAYSIVGRARNIGQTKLKEKPDLLRTFYEDKRHTLYREYLKILSIFSPHAFVMENVKGILSAKTGADHPKGSVIANIVADLVAPGKAMLGDTDFVSETRELGVKIADCEYTLVPLARKDEGDLLTPLNEETNPRDFLIRSEEHGVPQTRHRVIILGIRSDIFEKKGPPQHLKPSGNPCTLEQIIKSLPPLRSDITREKVPAGRWQQRVVSEIIDLLGGPNVEVRDGMKTEEQPRGARVTGNQELSDFLEDSLGPIKGHKTRSHMASDIARYYFCAEFAEREGRSPKLHNWPVGRLAPAHRDVKREGNRLTASGFSDRFKVQLWSRPASTITSHISKDGHYFIHPDKSQCRSLSVREAARIQTFPDSYQFCGGISKQFHQIGNAVPPFLAYQIASLVREYLER